MRILITGSRDFSDARTVMRGITVAIETLITKFPDDKEIVIVHGAARGADTLAENYVHNTAQYLTSKGYRIRQEKHPAKWDDHGRSAGPIRNQEMVDKGADICVAFIKGGAANRGTTDCSGRARKAGIEVLEFRA
jgi:hypothetical protein